MFSKLFKLTNDVHPKNEETPIETIESGILKLDSEVQFSKTQLSIEVKLLGKLMIVRFLQPEKEDFPMDVIPVGISISDKLVQFLNEEIPKLVTLFGTEIAIKLLLFSNA